MTISSTPYRQEDLLLFRQIFDDVVAGLHPSLQTSANRALIATRIMNCAATGERDAVELKVAALVDFQFAKSTPAAARYRMAS
jgi:hypothetical protein